MKLKALLFVAAMAVASTSMAATAIPLDPNGNPYSFDGGFSATATDTYELDLSTLTGPVSIDFAGISSTFNSSSGFDITSISFSGPGVVYDLNHNSVKTLAHPFGTDDFEFHIASIQPGKYYLTVTGDYFGLNSKHTFSGYTGQVTVTGSAPEPAAWSLMILGVGGMGAALRTRRRKVVAA